MVGSFYGVPARWRGVRESLSTPVRGIYEVPEGYVRLDPLTVQTCMRAERIHECKSVAGSFYGVPARRRGVRESLSTPVRGIYEVPEGYVRLDPLTVQTCMRAERIHEC